MAGTFSKNARPKRPGSYFNFRVRAQEPRLENTLGTVVLAFTHSAGPAKQIVESNSFAEWLAVFGRGSADPTVFTDGYRAAFDAFRGEGVDGRGGAGKVLSYRMAGSSAAAASKAIDGKITLTSIYEGDYGEQIAYTVGPDATDVSTHDNLVIYVEGQEVERYKYAKTNVTDLAAQINGTTPYSDLTKSDWVTAGTVTSGTAIAVQATPSSLTGGDNGETLVAQDYTDFMAAVEPHRFSLLAFSDLTDGTLLASLATWVRALNTKGHRFMFVFGGPTGESINDAANGAAGTAGASDFNSPDALRLGMGTYTDDRFGDLSTSMLAPRIAGILAWRGEALGLTYARLAGLSIKAGAKDSDIEKAQDLGVTTIARDSHPTAPVRLETAVTTYTTTSDPAVPKDIFGNPKFVRTMDGIETELTEFAESNVIGLLPVNAGTRDFVRGQMQARLQARENAGVIQPGWTVSIATDPAPSDDDVFVALDYQIKFGRDLQQILNTVVVG